MKVQTFSLGVAVVATLGVNLSGAAQAATLNGAGEYFDGSTIWTTQKIKTNDGSTLEFLSLAATAGLGFGANPYAGGGWALASLEDVNQLWDAFGFEGLLGDDKTVEVVADSAKVDLWVDTLGLTETPLGPNWVRSAGWYGLVGQCGGRQCLAGVQDYGGGPLSSKYSREGASTDIPAVTDTTGVFLVKKTVPDSPGEAVPEPAAVVGLLLVGSVSVLANKKRARI
jgi:hypothetical protein